MPRSPAPPSPAPLLPFSWTGGDPSVDFTNTVAWSSRGLVEERLHGYRDLAEWAARAGLVTSASRLVRASTADPVRGDALLAAAHELRSALHELFAARASGALPPSAALATLERWAAEAAVHRTLAPSGDALRWRWSDDHDLASPLRRVADAGARLLTGGDAARIRLCGNGECGWAFVDRSRRGNRRWCEMAACGSRDKARRYYRRQRAAVRPMSRTH